MEQKKISDQGLSSPLAAACASTETSQIIYVADAGNNRILKLMIPQYEPGNSPLHIFEAFKATLWVDDVDKVAAFFDDSVAGNYKAIFNGNSSSQLQNMISNMGQMSLESQNEGMAVYELSNSAGTIFYPVVFTEDDNGKWKIIRF